MKYIHSICFFLIFTACPLFLRGQVLQDTIPLHSSAKEGCLSNGLRYIIHRNAIPQHKIEFRLVLNVGAVLENEDEKGMSHFLEHMMFNGTGDYPSDRITNLLKEMGIKYGYDLNAFTDYDKTIYILPIPTDKNENIDVALNIIRNWLTSATLNTSDIEKEKKIVSQEIKDAVLPDIFYASKIKESRYAIRPVLGGEDDIQKFDSLSIRSYYDRWYRPDLATIIAVGDFDMQEMESKIIALFSSVRSRADSLPQRTLYRLPIEGSSEFQQEADSLLSSNRLSIIFPEIVSPTVIYRDLRNTLKEQLFRNMLSARISADSLLSCNYSKSWYLSDVSHHVFDISAKSEKDLLRSVQQTARLLAQIKQYGFLESEFIKAKKSLLATNNSGDYARPSQSYCNDYIDLAVTRDRYISNTGRYEFYKKEIEQIRQNELDSLIQTFFRPRGKIILNYLYNPNLSSRITKDDIEKEWTIGLNSDVLEYIVREKKASRSDSVALQSDFVLSVDSLSPAYIISEKKYDSINLTEFVLSNGLRVALRPTLGDNKEIMLSLIGRGGFSTLPIDKYPFYSGTAAYIDMSGAGNLDAEKATEFSYEKGVAISTNIDNYYNELYGVAFEGDIENLLKLLYLKVTDIKPNRKDFSDDIESQIASLGKENLLQKQFNRSPDRVLQNMIAHYSGRIHKNARELASEKEIRSIDLDSVTLFYKQLFDSPENMAAIVVGNYNPDSIKLLVVKYLGALPSEKSPAAINDIGFHFPDSINQKTIEDKDASRVNVTTLIHGEYKHSLKQTIIFKMMRDIIGSRLLSALREKEGLVYSPFVSVSYDAYPVSKFYFEINYYCDKENVSLLEQFLWEEMDKLKTSLIPVSELNSIKQSFTISKRENLSDVNTGEWKNKLREMYLEDGSISDFANYDSILSEISVSDIRESFEKYINKKQVMTISITNNK